MDATVPAGRLPTPPPPLLTFTWAWSQCNIHFFSPRGNIALRGTRRRGRGAPLWGKGCMIPGRPSCGADTLFRKVQGRLQGARDRGYREGKGSLSARRGTFDSCVRLWRWGNGTSMREGCGPSPGTSKRNHWRGSWRRMGPVKDPGGGGCLAWLPTLHLPSSDRNGAS